MHMNILDTVQVMRWVMSFRIFTFFLHFHFSGMYTSSSYVFRQTSSQCFGQNECWWWHFNTMSCWQIWGKHNFYTSCGENIWTLDVSLISSCSPSRTAKIFFLGSQNFSKFRNMLFCKCDYCLENIAFLAFNPLPACLDMPQAQPVTHSTGRYVWQMFPGLPTCT